MVEKNEFLREAMTASDLTDDSSVEAFAEIMKLEDQQSQLNAIARQLQEDADKIRDQDPSAAAQLEASASQASARAVAMSHKIDSLKFDGKKNQRRKTDQQASTLILITKGEQQLIAAPAGATDTAAEKFELISAEHEMEKEEKKSTSLLDICKSAVKPAPKTHPVTKAEANVTVSHQHKSHVPPPVYTAPHESMVAHIWHNAHPYLHKARMAYENTYTFIVDHSVATARMLLTPVIGNKGIHMMHLAVNKMMSVGHAMFTHPIDEIAGAGRRMMAMLSLGDDKPKEEPHLIGMHKPRTMHAMHAVKSLTLPQGISMGVYPISGEFLTPPPMLFANHRPPHNAGRFLTKY